MSQHKLSELPSVVDLNKNDLLLVTTNTDSVPESKSLKIGDLLSNPPSDVNALPIRNQTPSTAVDIEGRAGTMVYDENFLYLKVSDTVVKKIQLSDI